MSQATVKVALVLLDEIFDRQVRVIGVGPVDNGYVTLLIDGPQLPENTGECPEVRCTVHSRHFTFQKIQPPEAA